MIDSVIAEIVDLLPHLILGLILFFAFFVTGIILAHILRRITAKMHPDSREIFGLLARIIIIIFIVLGLVAALTNIGINVSALIAGIGIIGFALGYALKDVISSQLSGILVIIYRPFKINDLIKIGEHQGIVTKIDLRYITLEVEGDKILIPNGILFNNAVTVINNKEKL
jgi:small conductance mechanosensitive channel